MFAAADPYNNIDKKPPGASKRLVPILEGRAAEPQQQTLRRQVFDRALEGLPSGINVVDIGCGTGAIARDLARRPAVSSIIGIDPAMLLIEEAQRLGAADPNRSKLHFRQGLGGALPVEAASAHLAILWTVLCHVPTGDISLILREARRVLKPGGRVLVVDNDLSGWSVAMGTHDPLAPPLAWFVHAYIQDPWLCKKFPSLLTRAGFNAGPLELHTIVDVRERFPPACMPSSPSALPPPWCLHLRLTRWHAPRVSFIRRPQRTLTVTITSCLPRSTPSHRAVRPGRSWSQA